MRARGIAVVVAVTAAGAASAHAQEPGCRAEDLARADFLAGDWTITSRVRGPSGGWERSAARSRISWRLDGCVLVEEWSGEVDGRPLERFGLLAYDAREEKWDWTGVDSGHGNLISSEGRFRDDGALVLLHSEMRGGRLLIDRTIITPVSEGRFDLVMESSPDAGATWREVWRMEYRAAP